VAEAVLAGLLVADRLNWTLPQLADKIAKRSSAHLALKALGGVAPKGNVRAIP
jgi:hypothetical protein